MQNPTGPLQNILRWLVPIAAIMAIAAWFYISPEGALGKLDAIGYAVCHRIDERSFHVDGQELPLCARCTGEFNTAAMALIFQGFVSRKKNRLPKRGILAILIAFFLAFAIDGSNSYLYLLKETTPGVLAQIPNLYVPNNTLRLFTGSGMGLAVAAVLYPIMNQTLWRESDPRPALGWKTFGILVALTLAVDFAILPESPIVLYPIAYLSVFGVLALLIIVFGILWIVLMRQENAFDHLRQLWLSAAAGLTLTLLLVVSIDLVRYSLTGTWSGFPGLHG
ncbi:MAG TPA: DUF2085 domain-containing protein [Anaerolineales bacterium]|nr:DUF2085 domain-containing protein [Anaerolineales bacterium]